MKDLSKLKMQFGIICYRDENGAGNQWAIDTPSDSTVSVGEVLRAVREALEKMYTTVEGYAKGGNPLLYDPEEDDIYEYYACRAADIFSPKKTKQ